MFQLTGDTLISLTALVLGVCLYFFDLRKKINELLVSREGILTQSQAERLLDLYLDAVHHHLLVALRKYIDNDYRKDLSTGRIDIVMSSVAKAYESIVKDNKRQMVAGFELRGRKSFESVLNSADTKILKSTFSKAKEVFQESMSYNRPPDETRQLLEAVLLEGKSLGRALLNPLVVRVYKKSA